MQLYLFRCSVNKLRTGLTNDKSGSNLPANDCNGGKWEYLRTIDVKLGDPGRIGAPSNQEILDAIERNGYLISEAEIKFTEK